MTKPKVLLVEDDNVLVKMYSRKFLMEGFETEIAFNGQEALDKLKLWTPDIIVMDIMMPVMDGMQTLRVIKGNVLYKHIPVVLLTNVVAPEQIEEAAKLGTVKYLVKSDKTPNEVVSTIKSLLAVPA